MAMNIQGQQDDEIIAEINITPLTDIFLVLLIIFMISSSAIFEGGLQVKLPAAKGSKIGESKEGKPTYVTISAQGKISVNDHLIEDQFGLKQALKEAIVESLDKIVIIRGDESIYLGKAVEIMDAARGAGAQKIAIATSNPK